MPAVKTKSKNKNIFKYVEDNFKSITKAPEEFITAQTDKCEVISKLLQESYKLCTQNDAENQDFSHILPELIVEDMDEEQIWQQIELRNDKMLGKCLEKSSKLLALREQKLEIRLNEEDESESDEHNSEAEYSSSEEKDDKRHIDKSLGDEDNLQDEEADFANSKSTVKKSKNTKKHRPTVVDDQFFKLREMEEFLEAEDAKEMRKFNKKPALEDNDGIDYFAQDLGEGEHFVGSDDEDSNPEYKDFFDEEEVEDSLSQKTNKKDKNAEKTNLNLDNNEKQSEDEDSGDEFMKKELEEEDETHTDEENENPAKLDKDENLKNKQPSDLMPATDSESEESELDEAQKSSYEMRQQRLLQRIHDFEEELLNEKPWQLKGEVQGVNRPLNSLLEEVLEFDSNVRADPVFTEETTHTLEQIIKQRIKDRAFDDPVLVVRPVNTAQDYRKQLVLDQEKSKESLAQIYEKDYQREMDKLNPNRDDEPEEEPKEHKEIKRMMRDLFIKLDALSNFHFAPKPVAPEAKIITNIPAVAMEEVAPVAVSDAKLLAPEEVYRGPKNGLLGKSERTRTDKNRERRKKKQKQRAINKVLEAKDLQRQKLGIPLSKKQENAKLLKNITKARNVEKMTISGDQKALKSSKAFFSKLQDTTNAVHSNAKATKRKPDLKGMNAKKLKL